MYEDSHLEMAYEDRYAMDDDFSDMCDDYPEDDFDDDFPMELEYDDWKFYHEDSMEY